MRKFIIIATTFLVLGLSVLGGKIFVTLAQGGGGQGQNQSGGQGGKGQPSNPIPTINSISPSSATVGSISFTMTVNGTGFISTSVVRFDGNGSNTTFISDTQLTADIISNRLTATGDFPITVFNHPPDGGISNAKIFTVTSIPLPPPPSAGGQPTEIKFSGQAYPGAKITIFAKKFNEEFPVKQEDIISPTGEFSVDYIGILHGNYNYSLVIEDKEGHRSQVKSYNLGVYANSLNAKDIFAPPTLWLLRAVITKGDFLYVSGYAGSGDDVNLEIDDRIITGSVKADDNGRYKWLVNTAGLSFGNHKVRAKQSGGFAKISEWSPTVVFVISELINPNTDFNNDGIVNINDWSVFLSRWGSKDEGLRKQIDLNGDGKVNISDFSVFIRTLKL